MTLVERILQDYKEAMKTKDTIKVSILSFLRSELNYAAIEKQKKNLDDQDVLSVIRKQIKQHQDSIEQFQKGNRADLVEKEKKELEILKSYMPQEMPQEEIKKLIEETISATGASEMKDMGRLMKELMPKLGGRADGKLVNDLIKERLTKK
ncbi:MAG: GatB/YqeY domain-containing protein [Candidatus Omnitrophota bacterium]